LAEPLYKRALAIAEKALGPDHPDAGTDLNNLAVLYFAQGDGAHAADYWRRSTSVISAARNTGGCARVTLHVTDGLHVRVRPQ
jgi:hypothetical protein